MEGKLKWMDKQLGRMTGLFALVGSLGVMTLMIIIMIAVIWRYGINNPIFGIGDLSVLVLSVVAAASVIFGARNNAHVSIDIISRFFGWKVIRYTDALMRLLTIGILATASYALVVKACGFEKGCITENLSIVHRPFYYLLAVSMGLFTLQVVLELLRGLIRFNIPPHLQSGDD
ncbi:MAG: TRAP transporter small permease subunit [Rhizobiaceae bacterium]|nr:TRAP transporter small permease subunit [Rhizobiaceae bacterium]